MTQSLRIALAEDDTDLRLYYQKLLSRLGHCVVSTAENGQELVQQCREFHPDLVLTDVHMPGMNGLEAARAISQEQQTPILLMSAHFDPQGMHCAESDHIVGFIAKPFGESGLKEALEQTGLFQTSGERK
jgi:response regulator NasT